ncbi:hypothetical protein K435DRAFT_710877 [Dendrothele bispora CBS 962.96]|uniref:Uncharacterized protein n=1 Tax=Dendrothele bispora (strain CBS 962.96) TaxID=1314807 RepID=A0A4S8MW62_DENBC|nr:hypothetical protein K435DRAFT_710877 [Dendrothele bispora CBS 962.96]
MSSPFAQFGCLDELIQVVYQNFDRFVLISSVADDEWTLRVGLSGTQGRWWRGSWKDNDVYEAIGSKASPKLQEIFAQKLADCIIQKNVSISNWSPEPETQIKLTLSPPGKEPAHVPLTEISAAEAASFSTQVFLDIALRAQTRGNQLYGSEMSVPTAIGNAASTSNEASRNSKAPERENMVKQKEETIKPTGKRKESEPPVPVEQLQPKTRAKGASLANPNKKARKYQAQEFESDED